MQNRLPPGPVRKVPVDQIQQSALKENLRLPAQFFFIFEMDIA